MFVALVRLGPTRTAVVMTLEAFFAVVLAAVFLQEGLAPTQVAGGIAILVAAAEVAGSRAGPLPAEPTRSGRRSVAVAPEPAPSSV